ncbi:MAG: hypothetical protein NTW19_25055 [Planctomycetota bacterium]|nr:hypothetical protein [Planctomycetota bacterium]
MFDWLLPSSCPCDPAAKAWVEGRLCWLCVKFPSHVFNGRRVVLPTPEFFPDRYDGSDEAVRVMLDRVCGYMDVPPDWVELDFIDEPKDRIWLVNESGKYLPGAAGTFHMGERKFVVRVARSELREPMSLVGTLAHELAHVRLLGEGRLTGREFDHELLTDLTVVVFGMGLFLANTPRNWESSLTTWPGSDLNKPEYMTPPMFAYALAHLAWFQGDFKPAWAMHLERYARAEFKQALRFLIKTDDTEFNPDQALPHPYG